MSDLYDDTPLTEDVIHDKGYVDRVTGQKISSSSLVRNTNRAADEVWILPRVAHSGPCFIAFSRGTTVDVCECLLHYGAF